MTQNMTRIGQSGVSVIIYNVGGVSVIFDKVGGVLVNRR